MKGNRVRVLLRAMGDRALSFRTCVCLGISPRPRALGPKESKMQITWAREIGSDHFSCKLGRDKRELRTIGVDAPSFFLTWFLQFYGEQC